MSGAEWLARAALGPLPGPAHQSLAALRPQRLPQGAAVFHAGQAAQGFAVVLSGRIDVFLLGPNGRDILLYSVAPGQTCVQTTLGLLGDDDYTGEAIAAEPTELVLIPRALFLELMNTAAPFRAFVFRAFAQRMHSMMHVLEKVAFQRIESRLAQALIDLNRDGRVTATQGELASRIGSAREVVSRRLEAMVRGGLVATERGQVHLRDLPGLRRLAAADDGTPL